MSYLKWVGAIIGWSIFKNFGGAIIGYFVGSLVSKFLSADGMSDSNPFTSSSKDSFSSTSKSPNEQSSYGGYNKSEKSTPNPQASSLRQDFLYSLMVLSADIISADGKIMHSEMEFVRKFLRANFDGSVANQCNDTLLKLFEFKKSNTNSQWQKQILNSCYRLTHTMPEEYRQQLIAYLCEIAKADGQVDKKEIDALRHIALSLNLQATIIEQFLNTGGDSLEEAYKVLGLTKEATDDEVRKAYKRMAQKHHPDLVSNLGEDVRKAAEKKFQEIGNAKDIIYKARGMKR